MIYGRRPAQRGHKITIRLGTIDFRIIVVTLSGARKLTSTATALCLPTIRNLSLYKEPVSSFDDPQDVLYSSPFYVTTSFCKRNLSWDHKTLFSLGCASFALWHKSFSLSRNLFPLLLGSTHSVNEGKKGPYRRPLSTVSFLNVTSLMNAPSSEPPFYHRQESSGPYLIATLVCD